MSIVKEIDLDIFPDHDLTFDESDVTLSSFGFIGNFMIIYEVKKDQSDGKLILLDRSVATREFVIDSAIMFLGISELEPYILEAFEDYGYQLLTALRKVSISI